MAQINATPSLTFHESVKTAINTLTQFQGRSRRSEYWWIILIVWLSTVIYPLLGFILTILTIPLTFRRLHDVGKSGWWYGIEFILKFVLLIFVFADVFQYVSTLFSVEYDVIDGSVDVIDGSVMLYLIAKKTLKYVLIGLIMLAYKCLLIVFLCKDSDINKNQYGESPKYKEIGEENIND